MMLHNTCQTERITGSALRVRRAPRRADSPKRGR